MPQFTRLANGAVRQRPVGAADRDPQTSMSPRQTWIAALHIGACRRWLTQTPPDFGEAERTLEEIRLAITLTGPAWPCPDPVAERPLPRAGAEPSIRLDALLSHLTVFEKALAEALGR